MVRFLLVVGPLVPASEALAQGIFLPFAGAINQSMGGAGTAAPLDSMGALYWNPASISGLSNSEVGIGLGFVLPDSTLASQVNAGALGPFGPPVTLSGSTHSSAGVTPIPTMSFVQKIDDSPWTFGGGVFSVGGFSANYAASTTNPVLTPQPPAGLGLGQLYSNAQIYQISATASYAVTDKLSVGVTPIVSLGFVQASPLFFAPPNDANGDGFASYGPGTSTRTSWGGGFQVGAYYITDNYWHLGVSYKSPQWFEPIRYNSTDELGRPVTQKIDLGLPQFVSLGAAYSGFERWLYAADFRYYNYTNAPGFDHSGYNANGSVAGLGWNNIFSVSNGLQFSATDRWTLRMGYTFNQNPVPGSQTQFNVLSSLIIQHWLSFGTTFKFTPRVAGTIAYTHGFQNQSTGPFVLPTGPLAGTSITNSVAADIVNASLNVAF